MPNSNPPDAFGLGKLIDLRALNQQAQKIADAASLQVRQANRYIQEKQDKVHQNQRELGGRLQKSNQEFQAQWQRPDAPQAIRDSDGINLFKPVFDAAKATYEATAVHEVQEMVEDGRKAVEKKTGDAIGEGLKQANRNFRQGLRDAAPTLQALDRNIGQFDRDVHHALPAVPRLSEVSNAINQQHQHNRQAVHEFLMRKDVPAEWGQRLQSASRFMTAKGEHARYYSDATGLSTTAGYVQDIDLLHSVGKGGLKMAEMAQKPESREALRTLLTRIPQDRALWDARKAEELKEFQALHKPHEAPVPVPPETIARRIEDADRRVAEQAGKPHNIFDPAHPPTASQAAARDSALNSVRGVNPDGGEKNCMACVMATYDRHHGIPTSTFVNPGGLEERGARAIDLSILKTHFQSEWQQVHGLNELSGQLGNEGSSGVLWFSHNGQAHVLNVANVDGHIVLMDGQLEQVVSPRNLPEIRVQADGSTNFKFMPTPPPRNYQGIPPHGFIETPQQRLAEPAGSPRHTLIGPDGQARPATDAEVRQAIRDATPRNRVIGADGKLSLATDEEVRRGLQAASRPHAPEGGAHPPQRPEPTTGSAGAHPPEPPRPFGMRPQDQEIFAEAARREQRWIVVRETNPEALKYIGQPGYTPKPFECKAKSANVPEHKYAGLVVDPKRHPGAFQDPAAATAEWDKMLAQNQGDARFAIDRSGRLRFEGKLVHSDYDIYDVIHPDRPVNLSPVGMQGGQPIFETRGLPPIRDYVNRQVGSEVIQHPAEAQFKGHSEQRLIVFGPHGERFVTDGKQAIEDVYKERFPGRYALEQSKPAPPDNVVQFPKLRAVETPPSEPLKTPISRDELWRQGVQNQRGFQSTPSGANDRLRKEPAKIELDPEGVGPRVGKGFETFGAIQVLDKNGQRVEVGSGMFRGGGPESHAEARAIRGLEQNGPAKVEGGRMMVVVDQDPCPNCRQRILDYAQSRGIQEIEVHVPTRESLANRDRDVSPKTAAVTSFQGHRPATEFNTEVWSASGEVLSSAKARDARELVARARREVDESQDKLHQARALQIAQKDPVARQHQPVRPQTETPTESSAPKTARPHPETQRPQAESAAPRTTQPPPTESSARKIADQHPETQRPQAESSALKTPQPSPTESSAPKTTDQHPETQRSQAESSVPGTTQPPPTESSAPKTTDPHPETLRPQAESSAPRTTQPLPSESSPLKTADRQAEAKQPRAESAAPKPTQHSPTESGAPETTDPHPETQRPQAESSAPGTTQPSPTESGAPKTTDPHPETQRPQAESSAPRTTQPSPTESSAPKTTDPHPETRRPNAESSALKTTQQPPTESSAPKTTNRQPETQRPQAESSAPKTTQPSPTESSAPKTTDPHPETQRPQAESAAPRTTQPSPTESSAPKTTNRQPETQRPQAESSAPKTTQPSPTESSAPKTTDPRPETLRPQAESSAPKTTQPSPSESSTPKSTDPHPETLRSNAVSSAPQTTQPSPTESGAPKTTDPHPETQRPQAESSTPKTADQPSNRLPDTKSQHLPTESGAPKTAGEHLTQPPDVKSQPSQASREADPRSQPSPTEASAPKAIDPHPTRTTAAQSPKPSHIRDLGEAIPTAEAKSLTAEHPQAPTAPKASKTRDLGEAPQPPSPESHPSEAAAKTSKTRDLGEAPKSKESTPEKAADTPRPGETLSSNDRAATADDMKRKSGRDEASGDKHSAGGLKSTGSTSGHGDAPVEMRSAVDEMRRKSGRDEGTPPAPAPPTPAKDRRPSKS